MARVRRLNLVGVLVRLVASLYGLLVLLLSILGAMVFGTLFALPWIWLPRGRRERFAVVAGTVWSRFVIHGLLFARPRVTVEAPLSTSKGALIICNHRSYLDPMLLMAHTRSSGLAKRTILFLPFIGVYGWLAGVVYVDRRSKRSRARARAEVITLIRSGTRLQVFPEGTRRASDTLDDDVYLSLVRDAWEQGQVVVPCAVYATERSLPLGGIVAWPFQRSRLDVGKPMRPAAFPDADAFASACWQDVKRRFQILKAENSPDVAGATVAAG